MNLISAKDRLITSIMQRYKRLFETLGVSGTVEHVFDVRVRVCHGVSLSRGRSN